MLSEIKFVPPCGLLPDVLVEAIEARTTNTFHLELKPGPGLNRERKNEQGPDNNPTGKYH